MTRHTTPSSRTLRRSAGAIAAVAAVTCLVHVPPAGAATTGSDATAPRVVGHTPSGTGVSIGATVSARLDDALQPSTVSPRTVRLVRAATGAEVAASVRFDATENDVRLFPLHALARGAAYRVVVTTAVRDPAGNRLDQSTTQPGNQPARWIFRTQ